MMWGYGSGGWWMMLMPLVWIAVIAVVFWAVVRVVQTGVGGRPEARRETPLEILERRYALGEIDDTTYAATRARLTGREPSPR